MNQDKNEIIYKIYHVPTGLFYCSRKGRFKDLITNLSSKGNFYTDEKTVNKVLLEDCPKAVINKAQIEKFKIDISKYSKNTYIGYININIKDFIIKKYKLEEL